MTGYFSRTIYANVIHCAHFDGTSMQELPDVIVNTKAPLTNLTALEYAAEANPECNVVVSVESAGTVFRISIDDFIKYAEPVKGNRYSAKAESEDE